MKHHSYAISERNSGGMTKNMTVKLVFACLRSFCLLILLGDFPRTSLFLTDLIVCGYLCSIFRQNIRYLFLLHPFILIISSLFFTVPFLELGDGNAYQVVVGQYADASDIDSAGMNSLFESSSMLDAFKYMSLGVAPIFFIPDYLYGSPESSVYYLWEGCFSVILVALCATLAKAWGITRDNYLLMIVLFAVVSPSFFDLGAAPTRHIVTFNAVFLFYISFIALLQRFSISKLVSLLVAVVLVAISKFPLFIPLLIFCIYFIIIETKRKLTAKNLFFILVVIAAVVVGFDDFLDKLLTYGRNSSAGAATFSGMANIPIIGVAFKYLYALLAPFPWQSAPIFIATNYGGNPLLFFMHMLSSVTGVYFFGRLIVFGKPLLKYYPDIRPLVMFGLIMSLSIALGETGFHIYLLIYFPFFAPLFTIKRYQLSFFFPLLFILIVEVFLTVAAI